MSRVDKQIYKINYLYLFTLKKYYFGKKKSLFINTPPPFPLKYVFSKCPFCPTVKPYTCGKFIYSQF